MGRKKKVEEIKEEKITKNEPEEAAATLTPAQKNSELGYRGNVTVSIVSGNKVLSKRSYHNEGTTYLFKYLCECLAGQQNDADRPCKIRLFAKGSMERPEQPDWSESLVASAAILYDTTPVVKSAADLSDPNKYKVVFHFRIPYSYITKSDIAKLALYSSYNSDRIDAMSAYYLLTDETGTAYAPIEMPQSAYNNYSIIVEWEMSITNQIG